MRETKFQKLLKTLSTTEVAAFKHFVTGLYPTRTAELNFLEQELQPDSNEMPKQNEKPRNKNLLNKHSKLYGYLEEFLLWQQFKKNTFQKEQQMLAIFKARNSDDFFDKQLQKITKLIHKKSDKDLWDYNLLFQMNYDKFYYPGFERYHYKNQCMEVALQNLDKYFYALKLRIAVEIKNQQNFLNKPDDIPWIKDVVHFFKKKPDCTDAIQKLQMELIDLFVHKKNKVYKKIKNSLVKEKYELNREHQSTVLLYLINFVIHKIKTGELDWYVESFGLYKMGLEKNLLTRNGTIPCLIYNNIVRNACYLKEFEWADQFITKWRSKLPRSKKSDCVNFAKAELAFAQNKFEESSDFLLAINSSSTEFGIPKRLLEIKSWYELYRKTDPDFVIDNCQSTKQYIKRNKDISDSAKQYCRTFLNFVIRLLPPNKQLSKTITAIVKKDDMPYKNWLLEKAIQLREETNR